jgi:hypothetical protein
MPLRRDLTEPVRNPGVRVEVTRQDSSQSHLLVNAQ